MDRGEIIIYQTADGETRLDVRMENDSVWLTQAQMVELFNSTKQNVSLHINNLFKEGELERGATVKEYLIVQQEGHRSVKRKITAYNLDVIISVGYRVKSQRGTQFRIWANKVLKEYLIKGYAINSQAKIEQLEELKQTVRLLSNVLSAKAVTKSEAVGLLRVITDYTYGLDTLDRYDYQQLEVSDTTPEEPFHATYENAMEALQVLRDKFGGSELFAHEKDESSRSKALWALFTRLSAGVISTRLSRKRRPICSAGRSKTTRSVMATSALQRSCSCGSWRTTAFFTVPTARAFWTTTHWSP